MNVKCVFGNVKLNIDFFSSQASYVLVFPLLCYEPHTKKC